MKCSKHLLVCLMFQTLLIISEAGRNLKPNSQSPEFRSSSGGTSPGNVNSGRLSSSGTNVGRTQALGAPIPNSTPARPQTPGNFAGPRPQTSGNFAGPRPQTPGNSAWPRSQTPGTFVGPRPQTPGNSAGPRPQTPGNFAGPRPQTSGNFAGLRPQTSATSASSGPQIPGIPFRPQTPGAPDWPRFQTSVHFPSSVSSVGHSQYLTSNDFPALGPPDSTSRQPQNMPRSTSSSSISSTGSGYSLLTGRSSLSAQGSVSSGYGSSPNLQQPVGLDAPRSTAIQTSIASAETCVDRGTMPVVIAPAENCFDYFTLAVSWAPGYAYKQWKSGKNIRETKVSPSWIIHGLWPSMFDRRTDPMLTCRRTDISFNWNRFITNKILGTLDNTWYTILAKGYSTNTKLWEHEFNNHGSCASRSSVIGDDVNYFIRTIELVQQLNIGMTFASARYKVGSTTKLGDIIGIMENKLKVKIKIDYVLHQQTGENYLSELFICYDVNLRLMDCPNSALPNYILNTDIKLVEQLPRM